MKEFLIEKRKRISTNNANV